MEATLAVPFLKVARGESVEFQAPGLGRTVRVTLPEGAEDGARLRLRGKGSPAPGGGEPGDLYLALKIEPDARWKRDGLDLEGSARINLAQALLGCTARVETPAGALDLKLPAGIRPGSRLRLRGRGLSSGEKRGDFYARIEVELPRDLDSSEEEAIRAMAAKRGWSVS